MDRISPDRGVARLLIGLAMVSFVAFLLNNLALRVFLGEVGRVINKLLR